MIKKLLCIFSLFFFFFFSSNLFADINHDLNDYFDGLGMMSNTTAPHAFQGQQAGFYSGGSLYARNAVRNVQLIQVDLPNFRSGCGGIDAFAGGFSYVNSDQLINLMRNIMNNAAGYAFKLTLSTVSPIIKNNLSDIETIADAANRFNINSCETAEGLVDGMWPKIQASQQQVCRDLGSNTGIFSDWAAARQGCTSDDLNYNFDSTMQAGKENSQYKNMVFDNENLVWVALSQNALVSSDQSLAELLMSLSGSIIIKNTGNGKNANIQFSSLPSLASNHSLFKAILYGGNASIYRCDESQSCLNPHQVTVTISSASAFATKVANLLNDISNKILADDPLTKEEQGLIQSTRIPIYKILNVQVAYQKDPNILDIDSYADVIATDILFQYLEENLNLVKEASRSLQFPTDVMASFYAGVNAALADVRAEEASSAAHVSQALSLIQQSQLIEQMLAGQLSSQLGQSMHWAKSLH